MLESGQLTPVQAAILMRYSYPLGFAAQCFGKRLSSEIRRIILLRQMCRDDMEQPWSGNAREQLGSSAIIEMPDAAGYTGAQPGWIIRSGK